jgi:hypothetical protein
MNIVLGEYDYNYVIDDCLLHKYENVKNYKYSLCRPQLEINIEENENIDNKKSIYYIFDAPGEDAFAHWIYESFIFYPILLKVKNLYPNVKILTTNSKKYVKSMFKFLGINLPIVSCIENKTNTCFFSQVISLNELNNINLYVKYVNIMINDVNEHICKYNLEPIKLLLLPRNDKDNYSNNDRIIYGIEDIEKNVIDIGGVVMNTYQINNITLQLSTLSASEIIILDYGSSFLFNGLFCNNKKLIVLNNHSQLNGQVYNFTAIKILYDIIEKKNELIIVNSTSDDKVINYENINIYL